MCCKKCCCCSCGKGSGYQPEAEPKYIAPPPPIKIGPPKKP